MNSLRQHITEKLHINKNVKTYKYYPQTKDELIFDILDKIDKKGLGTDDKPLDLNDICTSEITDMSNLFNHNIDLRDLSRRGHFDISQWDVHNVENMNQMFYGSDFDGDLSQWDVSKVKDMSYMFAGAAFTGKNGDISNWNIKNVRDLRYMFNGSDYRGNIDDWDTQNVISMKDMFSGSSLPRNRYPKWYK